MFQGNVNYITYKTKHSSDYQPHVLNANHMLIRRMDNWTAKISWLGPCGHTEGKPDRVSQKIFHDGLWRSSWDWIWTQITPWSEVWRWTFSVRKALKSQVTPPDSISAWQGLCETRGMKVDKRSLNVGGQEVFFPAIVAGQHHTLPTSLIHILASTAARSGFDPPRGHHHTCPSRRHTPATFTSIC